LQKAIQLEAAQQFQPQPRSAELPAAFDSHARDIDFHPFGLSTPKQTALLRGGALGA
jgi:hypothetical protein